MRAFKYFFVEAAASLWRGRRPRCSSVLTIAGGLFVLGFFLALNANLQRLVGRWTESAELSVYLKDDATADQLRMVDDLVARQRPRGAPRVRLQGRRPPRDSSRTFPIWPARPTRLETAIRFRPRFEVRLKPEVRDAGAAVDNLATTLAASQASPTSATTAAGWPG